MDDRRLSTADVLAGGILSRPAPQTDAPTDREEFDPAPGWEFAGVDAVASALEAGKLVSASNYYGIPMAWKREDGAYRCILLQYRSVTEDETFQSAAEAARWFEGRFHATDG